MAISNVTSSDPFAALNGSTGGTAITANDTASADRFLKLLVAQMKNQDPLNPMDNAQVTSQMAQINTVDGINRLNDNVKGLNAQFVQLQVLQGAALVGREVTVPGDRLAIAEGVGRGSFQLTSAADSVKLEVLNGAGQVLASQDLGAASAGIHAFEWPAGTHADGEGLRFRITASAGAAALGVTPLTHDRVEAVNAGGDSLTLQLLRSGSMSYSAIKTVH